MTAPTDPNSKVLQALGLSHLTNVTAVDIQLRPGELPKARVEKCLLNFDLDNSGVWHWSLYKVEPKEPDQLDLEAMAEAARQRVAVDIELATLQAKAGICLDFARARYRVEQARWVRDSTHMLRKLELLPHVLSGFREVGWP